jgi:hypothetical protein
MERIDWRVQAQGDGERLLTLFFERARPARVVVPAAAVLLGGCMAIVMPFSSVLL